MVLSRVLKYLQKSANKAGLQKCKILKKNETKLSYEVLMGHQQYTGHNNKCYTILSTNQHKQQKLPCQMSYQTADIFVTKCMLYLARYIQFHNIQP